MVVFSLFVILYSMTVLGLVAHTGDLGIRCIFGQKVKEVAAYQWLDQPSPKAMVLAGAERSDAKWSHNSPALGDTITAIGDQAIHHYTDYVRSLRKYRTNLDVPVEVQWRSEPSGELRRGQVRVQRPPMSAYFWSVMWFLQEMLIFVVGAWVYWKRPRDDSAGLFFFLCVVTVGAFMGGYHWTQIAVFWPLIFLFAAFAVLVPVFSLHFYLVFPRRNPILAHHPRLVLGLLYGAPAVALTGIWGCMMWSRYDPDGRDVETALFVLRNLALGYVGLAVTLFLICFACLIYSYRTSRTPSERNQVRWILLATLLAFLPISWLLWDAMIDPARLGMTRSAWPMFIVSLLYTVAYALSITRYKLMQAERLLNRGVVYVVVSMTVGLLYSGGLVVGALLIGERLLNKQTSIGALVVCIEAIVVLILSGAATATVSDRHRPQLPPRKIHV